MADATQQGDGGRVIVWADQTNTFGGNFSAQGGWVELSGHDLYFAGDVQAKTLLLDPQNITIITAGRLPAYQLIDPNPANSNNFGSSITALFTGNFLVTSSNDQVGSGISTLTGNGNYVVRSNIWNNGVIGDTGAVTLGSSLGGLGGLVGAVSAAISLLDNTTSDYTSSAAEELPAGSHRQPTRA